MKYREQLRAKFEADEEADTYTKLSRLLDKINTLPQESKEELERKSQILQEFKKNFREYIK